MTHSIFANTLIATTLAFSSAAHAVDENYTFRAQSITYPLSATDAKSAFKAATTFIAEKTRDNTLPVGWKTESFEFNIGTIQTRDAKGINIPLATCKVVGNAEDNKDPFWQNIKSFGTNKQPVTYTAICSSGPKGPIGQFSTAESFTYEYKN